MYESSNKWWNSLSIKQMKDLTKIYSLYSDWHSISQSVIYEIWVKEGLPIPQITIPTKE